MVEVQDEWMQRSEAREPLQPRDNKVSTRE